jgi:dsRNA-specific ribonuclease
MSSINYETNDMFRNLITNILKRGNLKSKTINLLLDSEYQGFKGIQHYGFAFTHKSIHENNNYESYEFKGDSTANNCLVWYFSRRFPELNTTENVKTLARLKINYGSKKMFYTLGEKLGMWDYITAGKETRVIRSKKKIDNRIVNVETENVVDIKQTKKKSLLEDSFEAFIGVTQILLDEFVKNGMGYKICYNIISKLYDDLEIKLDHESLYDPKTRLKELFDKYCDKFGKWGKDNVKAVQYKNRYSDFGKWRVTVGYNIRTSDNKMEQLREMLDLYMYDDRLKGDIIIPNHVLNFVSNNFVESNKPTYKFVELGSGEASLKDDAEQMACESALKRLEMDGYKK